ncbi:hypothetical protein ACFQY7_23675 [Actinomadura luteofluorescens]|uniref:hypothetical protein n=1 Tax=Actinomadura luteofluorescens TaxID=46163 RepID=UPI00363AA6DC
MIAPVTVRPLRTAPRSHSTVHPAAAQSLFPETNDSDFGNLILNLAWPDFPGPLAVIVNVHS